MKSTRSWFVQFAVRCWRSRCKSLPASTHSARAASRSGWADSRHVPSTGSPSPLPTSAPSPESWGIFSRVSQSPATISSTAAPKSWSWTRCRHIWRSASTIRNVPCHVKTDVVSWNRCELWRFSEIFRLFRLHHPRRRAEGPQLCQRTAHSVPQSTTEARRTKDWNYRSKSHDQRAEARTESNQGLYAGDARLESGNAGDCWSDGARRGAAVVEFAAEGARHSLGWNDLDAGRLTSGGKLKFYDFRGNFHDFCCMHFADDGQASLVRVRLSNTHPRRADGELSRTSVAAWAEFAWNASEQSKDLRQLCVPPCAGEAGCAGVAIGQWSHGPAGEESVVKMLWERWNLAKVFASAWKWKMFAVLIKFLKCFAQKLNFFENFYVEFTTGI